METGRRRQNQNAENMNVLITGGLGYIGGRVAQHLAQSTAFRLVLSSRQERPELPQWLSQGGIIPHCELLRSGGKIWFGIDAVVHFGTANETVCNQNATAALLENAVGTLQLLEQCAGKVRRFIYFSTIHVYGSPLRGVLSEEMRPRPIQPYAIAHRTAEDFVFAQSARSGMEGTVCRLANAIGAPWSASVNRWTLVSNDLCRQAVNERTLRLKSSGKQWRSFVTLTDVALAVEHLLRQPYATEHESLYNLGAVSPMRIISLAELIADRCKHILGFRPEIVLPSVEDPEHVETFEVKMDRLAAAGFKPNARYADEIDDTLRYCAAAAFRRS